MTRDEFTQAFRQQVLALRGYRDAEEITAITGEASVLAYGKPDAWILAFIDACRGSWKKADTLASMNAASRAADAVYREQCNAARNTEGRCSLCGNSNWLHLPKWAPFDSDNPYGHWRLTWVAMPCTCAGRGSLPGWWEDAWMDRRHENQTLQEWILADALWTIDTFAQSIEARHGIDLGRSPVDDYGCSLPLFTRTLEDLRNWLQDPRYMAGPSTYHRAIGGEFRWDDIKGDAA